jgi:hypothetical protein
MRSKEIEKSKDLLKLDKKRRSILIGTVLGDAHLETQNRGRTYRLKIEHSIKQSTYVNWLYEQFREWVRTPPKSKFKYINSTKYENYGFQTLSTGQFRFYAKKFYDDSGRKVVPMQVGHWLTPLALAVWFMDDGSYKSKYHRAVILNTQGFGKKDINFLQNALLIRYGLETSIRKQSDGLQLMAVGIYAEQFYKIVQPHVLPDFTYKFGPLVNNLPKE